MINYKGTKDESKKRYKIPYTFGESTKMKTSFVRKVKDRMDQINNVFSNEDVPIYFLHVNNPQISEYESYDHYIEIEWDRSMCRSPIGRQKNIDGHNANKNVNRN